MPKTHFPWLVIGVLCALVALPAASADEPSLNERVSTFKKRLRSKDPTERARAFEILRGAHDPAVIDQLTWGLKQVRKQEEKIHKAQEKVEADYEKQFDKLERAKKAFEESGAASGDAVQRFNKSARKITKALDEATEELKELENDFTRNRALLGAVPDVAREVLRHLEGDAFQDAFGRVTGQWLEGGDVEDRRLWFDAVATVDKPAVGEALHAVLANPETETTLRVEAVDVLASREDGAMLGKAIEMLALPREEQPLLLAAIRALRRFHDKRGIPPLIAFLDREDLKRERTDAHLALVSLTGIDHGPYSVQWKKWWEDHGETFQMPEDSRPSGRVKPPKKGTTFYGIQTLSDKVLFVVDISGSMEKTQRGEGAKGKTKWEVLKQELVGAVNGLRPTDTFNVVFFNHQVIPWKPKKVEADERAKAALARWLDDQQPLGGTNLYDALEHAFRLAHRVTGPPDLDTVFFLTDGRPTAGKVRDRQRMLQVFKSWNETAHLTIHTIGVGPGHDTEMLKEFARIGDGRYVSTLPVPDIDVDAPAPELYGLPVLDFGTVPSGMPTERTLTVKNLGNGPLVISDLRIARGSKGYRLGPQTPETPITLEKDETLALKVLVEPEAEGTHEGTVRIQSNDGGDPILRVGLKAEPAK